MVENISAHFNYCPTVPLCGKSLGTGPTHAPAHCAKQRGGAPVACRNPEAPHRGRLLAAHYHVEGKKTARKTFGGAWCQGRLLQPHSWQEGYVLQ